MSAVLQPVPRPLPPQVGPAGRPAWKRFLQLKLYDNLLNLPTELWLIAVRTNIALMAATEATAWGFLGYVESGGNVAVATIAAAMIFALVGMVDIPLMVLDLKRYAYGARIYGEQVAGWKKLWAIPFIRVLMVGGSVVLSAPYLSQFVGKGTVDAYLVEEATDRIKAARPSIDEKYKGNISKVDGEIDELRRDLSREVRGQVLKTRPGTGMPGYGRYATVLKEDIAAAERRRKEAQDAYQQELREFEAAANARDGKALSRWGVKLPAGTMGDREEALRRIVSGPRHTMVTVAAQAFAGLVLAALMLLKLAAPESVEIYYSGHLQDSYVQWRAGKFDRWLPEDERSSANPSAMTPYRFRDRMLTDYPPIRAWELAQRREGDQARQLRLDQLDTVESEMRTNEATPAKEIAGLDAVLQRVRSALGKMSGELLDNQLAKEAAEAVAHTAVVKDALHVAAVVAQAQDSLLGLQREIARLEREKHLLQEEEAALLKERAALEDIRTQERDRRKAIREARALLWQDTLADIKKKG